LQDSNKIKRTECKNIGLSPKSAFLYLPRVLFFNAFELGAENANQVISSDEALRSAVGIKKWILSK
jgi:hypothetical protein